MQRILRNTTRVQINTTYNGKNYRIRSKGTIALDHNGRDEQAADYLLQTYRFLRDETPKENYSYTPVPKAEIQMAYGSRPIHY